MKTETDIWIALSPRLSIVLHEEGEQANVRLRSEKDILSNNVPIIGGLLIGEDDPSSGYGRQYSYYRYYNDDRR